MRFTWTSTWSRTACGLALAGLGVVGCSSDTPDQGALASGGVAAMGGTTSVGATASGLGGSIACPAGTALCGPSCVDIVSNPSNCGTCGVACAHPSQQCASGQCVCAPGYSDCGAGCADTASDPANCGACGTACVAPQLCSLGSCSDSCAAGLTACGQSCVDLQNNAAHCGVCNNGCAAGSTCVAGACECSAGLISCGGTCIDPLTDAQNCGACAVACDSGLCLTGVCQVAAGSGGTGSTGGASAVGGNGGTATGGATTAACEAGSTACGNECVDLQTDPNHCGDCYNACLAGTCNAGVCPTVKDCYAPTEVASPSFTDFEDYDGTTDVTAWGFAFNAPATVYAGPYFYDDSTGTPDHSMVTGANSSAYALDTANPASSDYGGGMGFWMGCIDATAYAGISLWVRGSTPSGTAVFSLSMEDTSAPLEEDPEGGGTCVATAAEGDCSAASVEIPVTTTWTQLFIPWASFTGGTAAAGAPVPVDGHNITGMNFNVSLNYVPEDPNDPSSAYVPEPGAYELVLDDIQFIEADVCPAGQALCGVGCVDYQTDQDNCGSCGNACDAGRACATGTCECPSGYTDCSGKCVDLQTSLLHCGACGATCLGECVDGSCQASGPARTAAEVARKLGRDPNFLIGMGNDLADNWENNGVHTLGVTLDIHYIYLVGLPGDGGWADWNPNGSYPILIADIDHQHGVTPMSTLFGMAAWGENNLSVLTNADYMGPYWQGLELLFRRYGEFGEPAIVHLEPDFWGYAQTGTEGDPSAQAVILHDDCGDLPADLTGMGRCMVRLARQLAPNVVIGFHASPWAGSGTAVGGFLNQIGAGDSDIVVIDMIDRDAGCFEAGAPECQRSGNFYWDETNQTSPNFHEHLAWARDVAATLGKPILWWQIPFGVPSNTPGGTPGHYRDNRVRYVFDHIQEFVDAGGVGATFGVGADNQTYITSDGGQFQNAVTAYFQNPVPLP